MGGKKICKLLSFCPVSYSSFQFFAPPVFLLRTTFQFLVYLRAIRPSCARNFNVIPIIIIFTLINKIMDILNQFVMKQFFLFCSNPSYDDVHSFLLIFFITTYISNSFQSYK